MLELHGPSMFAVKAKIYGVSYNQSSSIAFDETSINWSAPKSCRCVPILLTTFPPNLSGTYPYPRYGAPFVRPTRQKAPNFLAFHWSPHGSLVSIGQHFVTTRVVHLPKRTETSLLTDSDRSGHNHRIGPGRAGRA